MKQTKKRSFWSRLGDLIFGEPKKAIVVHNSGYQDDFPEEVAAYVKADVISTHDLSGIHARSIKASQEEQSELDYLKEKFAIDIEKRDQRLKKTQMREQRWLDWTQRRAARDELRFRRSILRDAQKQLRQTLKDDRDIQKEAEGMLQWLAGHSTASSVATGAIEMAGGVMTALRVKPDVVSWIQENLDMDIADVYFKAIDDMIDATKRFEKAEDALIQAFEHIEKAKEESLESVIPKGLEI